jgi:signal transduction histidine kinase
MTLPHRSTLDPPTPVPAAPPRPTPRERSARRVSEPLAGVHSALITQATRRVAWRLHDEAASAPGNEPDAVSGLLAALALAVDHHRPDYVSLLLPCPSPELARRLVEMLRAELLAGWAEQRSSSAPTVILDALTALEQVHQTLERGAEGSAGQGISGADALGLFVEVVHDLRSPLTSILCLADTLQQGRSGDVTKLQHRQLGLIYSAALGLSGLVSDALELARDSKGMIDDAPTPLSLRELLDDVGHIVQPMAEEKALRIGLHPIEPDHRLGYPVLLERVLLNLTTNALKFTEQGSVAIVCAPRGETQVEFAVSDTGPGINPEAMASLYEPFRRAHGRAGYRFSGTGLGLAISRKLVRAMGGDLEVQTGPQGTRFFFVIDLPVLVAG